jgi:hypothetical protein
MVVQPEQGIAADEAERQDSSRSSSFSKMINPAPHWTGW